MLIAKLLFPLYEPPEEMGGVSEFILCHQLDMVYYQVYIDMALSA